VLLAVALLASACRQPEEPPIYRVERRDFVHRVSADGVLEAREVEVVTVPPQVRRMVRIVWLAAEGTRVKEGDVVARFDASEMERRLEEGSADVSSSRLKMGRAEDQGNVRLSEIATDREAAGLELDVARRFQKRDATIFSQLEIAESRIDEEVAGERRSHADGVYPVQEELSRAEVDLLDVDRRRAATEVDQAREGLAALEVRAPRAGAITWTRDWQGEPPRIGDQVWKGQELGQIPSLDDMKVEVFVLEADAGGLATGKPATVTIEAHPRIEYQATIERVESVAKPRFRRSPVQYFGVTLALERTDPEIMKPGQRVRATLFLDEVRDALVVPRQAITIVDGEPRVLVKTAGGLFEVRAVELGSQSPGLVVVSGGLEEGDVVSLAAPTAPSSRTPSDDQKRTPSGPGGGVSNAGGAG
jgi:multidrug resistance efflux pump